MPNGGRLRIEVEEAVQSDLEGVRVLISDDGAGIRCEFLDKVFEPFFTTKGDLGTGIGLRVSKQLVKNTRATSPLTAAPIPVAEEHRSQFFFRT